MSFEDLPYTWTDRYIFICEKKKLLDVGLGDYTSLQCTVTTERH